MNFINILFPKYCYYCKKEGSYLCKNCINSYVRINWEQRCFMCGKVCSLGFAHKECRESGYLDGLIYFTIYDSKIKEIVKDIKYNFYFDVLSELGEIMSEYLKLYHFSDVVLTDVPLHKRKFRSRGFNQSQLLAKTISKRTGLKYSKLLKRKQYTITQVGLTREERENNLREAFEMNLKSPTKVVVVDDVYTTGTTLNQCAKILKQNGAIEVYGFVFAKSRE